MDPKKELDKKHFDNMMKIVKRKREESKVRLRVCLGLYRHDAIKKFSVCSSVE